MMKKKKMMMMMAVHAEGSGCAGAMQTWAVHDELRDFSSMSGDGIHDDARLCSFPPPVCMKN